MDEKKNKEDGSYEFIKETIKKKPLDRKKMWKAAGVLAGAGAIFGLTAALVFAVVEPQISQAVENKKRTEQKVEIPTDEETEKKEEQQTDAGIATEDISESEEGEQSGLSIDNYSEMYKEVLKKAESLTGNPKALAAIRRLRELYQVATCYGCEEYISFALGMLSKYQYYTGIIFQGFTYGTGEPLVTGGRYNKLLEHFGRPAPAIGFCLVMEQVLNALNRQNIQVPVLEGKRLVLYNERNREAAIQIAGMQRTHGMQIQCMRMEEGLKAEDYIVYGKSHQFTDIVSPVGEDQIQVINLFTDEVQMTNQKSFQ